MEPGGCLTCLYSRVVCPHVLQASWPCMSPVPLCGTPWGAPSSLNTRTQTKPAAANRCDATELHTVWASPFKAMGQFIGPSLKAMRTLLIRPILKVMGNCFPWLPRHLGGRARLPPFTLQALRREHRFLFCEGHLHL